MSGSEHVTTPSFSININGELNGFFNGAKGLRQGDPLSPYLFVIVMQALVGGLRDKCKGVGFKYHQRYKDYKIANLCFVDDLMIFCHGDVSFVNLIKKALREFETLSSLSPSLNLSGLLFGC